MTGRVTRTWRGPQIPILFLTLRLMLCGLRLPAIQMIMTSEISHRFSPRLAEDMIYMAGTYALAAIPAAICTRIGTVVIHTEATHNYWVPGALPNFLRWLD
jgi:hypothetical protein